MKVSSSLSSVINDEEAPVRLRYRALQLLQHPSLNLLRRLLVEHKPGSKASRRSTYKEPVPRKLRALAAIRYAEEWRRAQLRREQKTTHAGGHEPRAKA